MTEGFSYVSGTEFGTREQSGEIGSEFYGASTIREGDTSQDDSSMVLGGIVACLFCLGIFALGLFLISSTVSASDPDEDLVGGPAVGGGSPGGVGSPSIPVEIKVPGRQQPPVVLRTPTPPAVSSNPPIIPVLTEASSGRTAPRTPSRGTQPPSSSPAPATMVTIIPTQMTTRRTDQPSPGPRPPTFPPVQSTMVATTRATTTRRKPATIPPVLSTMVATTRATTTRRIPPTSPPVRSTMVTTTRALTTRRTPPTIITSRSTSRATTRAPTTRRITPTLPPVRPTSMTTTPAPVKELVCTVGMAATLAQMYPPDGLCHYLYYTHVFIVKQQLRSTEAPVSLATFKDIVGRFKQTQGGLAFDYRYTTPQEIKHSAVRTHLTAVSSQNIPHIGVLNLIARKERMPALMTQAQGILEAMKEVQDGDARRKTILAIGLYGYNEPNAWNQYKNWIREATTFRADTVIAISSTIQFDYFDDCKAAPPDVLTAKDLNYPDFKRHGQLVALSAQYSNPLAVVGLSLDMGAHLYNMRDAVSNPAEVAYKPCLSTEISGADVGCENGTGTRIPESSYVSLRVRFNQSVVMFDLPETVEQKVSYIKNLPPRRRFSWLYFDLHWADFLNTCKQKNPFEKVETLKRVFGIGPRP